VFDPAKISAKDIAAVRGKWGVSPGQCVIFVPARLTRWKGQLILIEAARMLQQRRPNAVRIIPAGEDHGRRAYTRALPSAMKAGALRQVVAMVGHLRPMPLAFAASDMAVSAVIEAAAFGRGAVEAEALGVPVMASKLGGCTEPVAEGETGF